MAPHSSGIFLPGKSHGRRSLVGCSPWGCYESDTTEWLHFDFSLSCIGGGNGNPLQCSCLENPRDSRAWWAAVYGVAQSRTRLKRLSSSSSSNTVEVDTNRQAASESCIPFSSGDIHSGPWFQVFCSTSAMPTSADLTSFKLMCLTEMILILCFLMSLPAAGSGKMESDLALISNLWLASYWVHYASL